MPEHLKTVVVLEATGYYRRDLSRGFRYELVRETWRVTPRGRPIELLATEHLADGDADGAKILRRGAA